MYLMIKWINLE